MKLLGAIAFRWAAASGGDRDARGPSGADAWRSAAKRLLDEAMPAPEGAATGVAAAAQLLSAVFADHKDPAAPSAVRALMSRRAAASASDPLGIRALVDAEHARGICSLWDTEASDGDNIDAVVLSICQLVAEELAAGVPESAEDDAGARPTTVTLL